MPPGRPALLRASGDLGIVVKLVVPDDVKVVAVIDLIECSSDRIVGRVAGAAAAFHQRRVFAAGDDILLAEALIGLDVAPEEALPLLPAAGGERSGIELEYKPPIDRMAGLQQRHGRGGREGLCTGRAYAQ